MSKGLYNVINGVTHKVKKQYFVLDGVTREIKKSYQVVDGMAQCFYSGETFGGYTGAYTTSTVTIDGAKHTLYTLTGSGTLTLNGDAQYWMCGGGGNGSSGTSSAMSGGGGGGGYIASGALASGTHVITVGAAKGNSIIGDLTANCGATPSKSEGGAGGSGGGAGRTGNTSSTTLGSGSCGYGQGEETYPFGVTSLKKHCAGGGGGGYITTTQKYALGNTGGTNGGNGSTSSSTYSTTGTQQEATGGTGGERGGGTGGSALRTSTTYSYINATAATFYGSGGGGYGATYGRGVSKSGAGYQGVVYLLI